MLNLLKGKWIILKSFSDVVRGRFRCDPPLRWLSVINGSEIHVIIGIITYLERQRFRTEAWKMFRQGFYRKNLFGYSNEFSALDVGGGWNDLEMPFGKLI